MPMRRLRGDGESELREKMTSLIEILVLPIWKGFRRVCKL